MIFAKKLNMEFIDMNKEGLGKKKEVKMLVVQMSYKPNVNAKGVVKTFSRLQYTQAK